MKWAEADFRGTRVWAEVDDAGRPRVVGGRRAIRYNDAPGAKVYRGSAADVKDGGGPVLDLDGGVSADAPKPSKNGSGFGKAGTRSAAQSAAAATDARARIAALPPEAVLAFTDGACTGNPGPAGSGVVVRLPDGRHVERYAALGEATNNIGELTAIRIALDVLAEEKLAPETQVALFTDSSYAIGVLSKGWKPKANVELIGEIKVALRRWKNLELNWVAGHVGVKENERADALARKGVEESRGRR